MAPLPPSVFLLVTGSEDSRHSGSRDSSSSRDGSPSHLRSSSWSLGECRCRCSQRQYILFERCSSRPCTILFRTTKALIGHTGSAAVAEHGHPPLMRTMGVVWDGSRGGARNVRGRSLRNSPHVKPPARQTWCLYRRPYPVVARFYSAFGGSQQDEEETKYDSLDDKSSGTEQDDDDDDAEEQHFKQVLGAGVERVSRHRTLTAQKLHDDGDDMKHGANDGDERAARQRRLW
ncbi:hypothetical protein EDB84DRAFT_428644 [Lactarius hengduanensis]|nr:hypothetical protein EDB84DRAFT_428644 [Lactarius hengduanensis]